MGATDKTGAYIFVDYRGIYNHNLGYGSFEGATLYFSFWAYDVLYLFKEIGDIFIDFLLF